ncbi:uncharacterized protein LOC111281352 [Durio zibethinus]|uniref:Uncharacterized protein LOC111281352 n=1 Tax=Durio zibethinus TaxID=66656 RepID=A0A6P5XAL2_DURZI|nr:uncharacterized protein LOC111281352 [Durio zibethinus]
MAANVCCSIEMEPRTLKQGQLNHAREMAADVAQKMKEDASAVFIEGLGLVSAVEIKEVNDLTNELEKEVGVEKHVEYCNQKAQNIVERPCQCSCDINNIESPDPNNIILNNVKEPVTAPF